MVEATEASLLPLYWRRPQQSSPRFFFLLAATKLAQFHLYWKNIKYKEQILTNVSFNYIQNKKRHATSVSAPIFFYSCRAVTVGDCICVIDRFHSKHCPRPATDSRVNWVYSYLAISSRRTRYSERRQCCVGGRSSEVNWFCNGRSVPADDGQFPSAAIRTLLWPGIMRLVTTLLLGHKSRSLQRFAKLSCKRVQYTV